MTPPLSLLGGDTLVVSPTQLDLIKTCPRMWLYRYLYKRTRAGAFAARDGGKAFDAALNRRYIEARSDAPSEALQEAMLADIRAGFDGLDLPLDEYRTSARYQEVTQAYNTHYGVENFDVLGVQVPFAVELGGVQARMPVYEENGFVGGFSEKRVRIILRGILDLLIRTHQQRLVLVTDTKTSNTWDERRASEYENNSQMKAYCYAVPQIKRQAVERGCADPALAALPDQVHGCMVNAVVIRPPYKREGSADKPNARPRNEFHRRIYTYTPERLEEWRKDALAWCQQALQWVAADHFPQNEKHCCWHFGKKCGYLDVCSVAESQREDVLGSDLYTNYEGGSMAVEVKEGEV